MKPLTARQIARIAEHLGWCAHRQRGSHCQFRNVVTGAATTIPMHSGDLPPGTQRSIMHDLGITPEELPRLLKEI